MQQNNKHLKKFFICHKILISIIFLGSVLRLFNINSNPISPYWDEASIGYNAYSISQTARDEWGKFLPASFQSFGEYKLPGQIYLTVPFTLILGLNNFSVRLPSALMGILAIYAIYLLAVKLTEKNHSKRSRDIALFAAFLLATSPWHLQFSRASFEANSATTLYIFGIYFLLSSLKKPYRILFSSLFFSLSFYFYYHTRIIVPIILIVFVILYLKSLIKNYKFVIISLLFGLFFCLPILLTFINPASNNRAKQVSIISLKSPQSNPDFVSAYEKYQSSPIPSNLKDKLAWSDVLFKYYLRHLDPNFLFVHGDSQIRHRTPNTGQLYYFQIPLVLFSILYLIAKKTREHIFALILAFIFPISAIFSDLTPHALRSSLGSINLTILSAFGIIWIQKLPNYLKNTIPIIITLSIGLYLYQYHLISPKLDSVAWGYGHKELFSYLEKYPNESIIVTGRYWNPYIYYLYYNQFPPKDYQNIADPKIKINNYYFAGAGWDGKEIISNNLILKTLQNQKTSIIVTSPAEDSSITINKTHIHTINDKENNPIFLIYKISL